mmetsp:Transcript_27759/g.84734  ORF Transcript_27759/g.84734 Transcript_27759/m.84734 type:complete len:208 (-) Transcript_27759:321-944(-)
MKIFSSRGADMHKQLFDLKFTSRQFEKMAAKSTKQEREELLKVKKALESGNMDIARIHGQNAIRIRNTGTNYLRLASRMDAVASRVEAAVKMKQVTKQMSGVVKGMDKVLATMDLEKIAAVMDQFEKSFDSLDLTSATVEGAMGSVTATSIPEDEVDALINQQSELLSLDVRSRVADASRAPVAQQQIQQSQEDELEKRLKALRAEG